MGENNLNEKDCLLESGKINYMYDFSCLSKLQDSGLIIFSLTLTESWLYTSKLKKQTNTKPGIS